MLSKKRKNGIITSSFMFAMVSVSDRNLIVVQRAIKTRTDLKSMNLRDTMNIFSV